MGFLLAEPAPVFQVTLMVSKWMATHLDGCVARLTNHATGPVALVLSV